MRFIRLLLLTAVLAFASAKKAAVEYCSEKATVPSGKTGKSGSKVLAFDVKNTGNGDLSIVALDVGMLEFEGLQVYTRVRGEFSTGDRDASTIYASSGSPWLRIDAFTSALLILPFRGAHSTPTTVSSTAASLSTPWKTRAAGRR